MYIPYLFTSASTGQRSQHAMDTKWVTGDLSFILEFSYNCSNISIFQLRYLFFVVTSEKCSGSHTFFGRTDICSMDYLG